MAPVPKGRFRADEVNEEQERHEAPGRWDGRSTDTERWSERGR